MRVGGHGLQLNGQKAELALLEYPVEGGGHKGRQLPGNGGSRGRQLSGDGGGGSHSQQEPRNLKWIAGVSCNHAGGSCERDGRRELQEVIDGIRKI